MIASSSSATCRSRQRWVPAENPGCLFALRRTRRLGVTLTVLTSVLLMPDDLREVLRSTSDEGGSSLAWDAPRVPERCLSCNRGAWRATFAPHERAPRGSGQQRGLMVAAGRALGPAPMLLVANQ